MNTHFKCPHCDKGISFTIEKRRKLQVQRKPSVEDIITRAIKIHTDHVTKAGLVPNWEELNHITKDYLIKKARRQLLKERRETATQLASVQD
jgi:hypothetical protein